VSISLRLLEGKQILTKGMNLNEAWSTKLNDAERCWTSLGSIAFRSKWKQQLNEAWSTRMNSNEVIIVLLHLSNLKTNEENQPYRKMLSLSSPAQPSSAQLSSNEIASFELILELHIHPLSPPSSRLLIQSHERIRTVAEAVQKLVPKWTGSCAEEVGTRFA